MPHLRAEAGIEDPQPSDDRSDVENPRENAMSQNEPTSGLELRSEIGSPGTLTLSLARVPVAAPADDEVVVRIEATPINPSDLGLLLGPADISTLRREGEGEAAVVTAMVPPDRLRGVAARLDQSMPVGNEGAGVVIRAGTDARHLLGRTVAILGGAMYAQYRTVRAAACLPLPEGVTAAEGASAFVNPLTALGMVETMRREGHKALVHTAAASNLGQMLTRLCLQDGVELVNIVRSAEQAALLRDIGASHVCDSSAPTFLDDLTDALVATGATIAFDAIGGGLLGGQILSCMEAAANRSAHAYSRYGSQTHKQLNIYGSLDPRPTQIDRSIGMAWSAGGWLVSYFLERIGAEAAQRLRGRVLAELKTTFASRYTAEIALTDVLDLSTIRRFSERRTGEKYLINPSR
jgi:NADPH2:quinone reductase